MRRFVRVLVPVLILALVVAPFTGRVAVAAEAPDDLGAVQGLIKDAVAEYDAGHFEEARALFRTAHAQSPSARTLRGIGMASFELRDYVEATRTLMASLGERRRALTPEQRRHVEGLLARTEAFVGRFAVRLTPPDANILVDGKPAERETDGTLVLSLGTHQVVARCPSCLDVERDLQVVGGERQELVLALDAAGGDRGAPRSTMVAGSPATVQASARTPPGSVPYWLAGAAVLSAAGAVAGAVWWRDRASELDGCRAVGSRCQNASDVEGERNTAAGVTLGLAATAVATGIVAVVLWTRRSPSSKTTLACFPGLKGGTCAIRF